MSDGGQITVELVAKIDELNAGLREAVSSIQEATGQMRESFKETGEKGKEMDGLLKAVLEGGAFLEFKEIAKEALEAVQEAFEKTAGKAQEFALTTSKFAAMMGSTTEHAAGLEAALNSVGVSIQEYEQLAMRMQMRLMNQEESFNRLGMATRDHNHALLQGEDLMQSAIATMQQYRVGTDQNEFALQVFGRRAQDIYDIMRANKVEQQGYIDDMKALGVNVKDSSQAAVEQEAALGRLKQMWTDMEIALGQQLMPLMTDFFHFLHDVGIPALKALGDFIKFVIEEFVWFGTTMDQVATVIAVPLAEMTDMLVGFAIVAYDVLTLKWGRVAEDAHTAWQKMKADWHDAMAEMDADSKAYAKTVQALYGERPKEPKGEEENIYAKGGKKHFVSDKEIQEARKAADERARLDESLALGRIKEEELADSTLLALGRETLQEYVQAEYKAANDRYQAQLTYLQQKAKADAGDKLLHQKDLDQIKELEQKHVLELDTIHSKYLEKKRQLDQQETQQFIQDSNDRLQNGIQELEEEYKRHLLSVQEKAQAERQLTITVYKEELARLDAELAGLKKGTEEWNRAYKERQKIAEDFHKAVTKIDNQLFNEEHQKWETLKNSIRSSFNSALNGMLLGTESWQQALGQIIDSIANSFLQMGEKMLEDWIEQQIAKALFTETTQQTTQAAEVFSAANIAAANTLASWSGAPWPISMAAPEMAAVAFNETLAFAEQGMLLDRDRLVFAHKDEQILPANISRGMQDLISGGGAGRGDVNFHYGPTVNAPMHKSLNQLLFDEGSSMLSWLNARMRDGALKIGG